MDILIISKYILIIAVMIMMIAALRASAYKTTSMGLLGSSVVVVAFAVAFRFIFYSMFRGQVDTGRQTALQYYNRARHRLCL